MSDDVANLKDILVKEKDTLKSKYNVESIGIFGSFATGKNTNSSDVDVLVELSKPIGLFKFIELEEYLGKLFDKKVDLATKNALKPAIKHDILQEVIYA
jgi:predicted nucleotidyltransferase